MSNYFIGLIGGSGLYHLDDVEIVEEHTLDTPFGRPSAPIVAAKIGGVGAYFLARHGTGHTLLPHEVNYRANIFALKKLGVRQTISISAVGSLREELAPGTFCLPDNFIDWTKGRRERTFFGDGIVAHISTAEAVNRQLQERIFDSCTRAEISCSRDGIYLCIEGPQFSSKAESHLYRSFGASLIGMTNIPEAYLAKEAGMAYATVGMVTDYDCWRENPCRLDEILKVMGENTKQAQKLISDLVPSLGENPIEFKAENREGIFTPLENLDQRHQDIVEVLLR